MLKFLIISSVLVLLTFFISPMITLLILTLYAPIFFTGVFYLIYKKTINIYENKKNITLSKSKFWIIFLLLLNIPFLDLYAQSSILIYSLIFNSDAKIIEYPELNNNGKIESYYIFSKDNTKYFSIKENDLKNNNLNYYIKNRYIDEFYGQFISDFIELNISIEKDNGNYENKILKYYFKTNQSILTDKSEARYSKEYKETSNRFYTLTETYYIDLKENKKLTKEYLLKFNESRFFNKIRTILFPDLIPTLSSGSNRQRIINSYFIHKIPSLNLSINQSDFFKKELNYNFKNYHYSKY